MELFAGERDTHPRSPPLARVHREQSSSRDVRSLIRPRGHDGGEGQEVDLMCIGNVGSWAEIRATGSAMSKHVRADGIRFNKLTRQQLE